MVPFSSRCRVSRSVRDSVRDQAPYEDYALEGLLKVDCRAICMSNLMNECSFLQLSTHSQDSTLGRYSCMKSLQIT